MTAQAERLGAGDDHGHGHVHACHVNVIDSISPRARWKHHARGAADRVHELQLDRSRRARNAVNCRISVIQYRTVLHSYFRKDTRTRVHCPNFYFGHVSGR